MNKPTVGSLFSGCGGFDLGFHAAGFDVLWQVEIDSTARDVLRRHWPDAVLHEDVRAVGGKNLPAVDVVVGGFPCQDLSTAGRRAGFAGERSSLFFEMARVIRELRPAYVVWENVPGLLSSAEGRDFLAVLVELGELGFDGGWRSLDAQFFGVPQQRRRVFGVFARGRAGAERCAEVLALREGGTRRTPPRRKAGAGTAGTAPGGAGVAGGVAPCLRGNGVGTERLGGTRGQDPLVVFGVGAAGERAADGALTSRNQRQDFDTENFVLIQDARSADTKAQGGLGVRVSSVSYTLDTQGAQAVCVTVPVTHTLPGQVGSEDGTGRGTPIVFNWQSGGDCRLNPSEVPDALSVGQTPALYVGSLVRRLTPRECERLMGWPDDHTRWRADGREIADGPRYRMCGNGVVGTVAEWIARRLRAVMEDSP